MQWSIFENIIHIKLNFFEAMDLYRTLAFKSNLMDSSHFENNFKRMVNCPATQANKNEPSKEGLLTLSLLCDVPYSTMKKLSWELLIYLFLFEFLISFISIWIRADDAYFVGEIYTL